MLFKAFSVLVLLSLASFLFHICNYAPTPSVVIFALWLGAALFWIGLQLPYFIRFLYQRLSGFSFRSASSGEGVLLYVGNLDYSLTEEEVRQFFSDFGTVLSIRMMQDPRTKRFRGYCFIEMPEKAAEKAISVSGEEFKGRKIRINLAKDKRR